MPPNRPIDVLRLEPRSIDGGSDPFLRHTTTLGTRFSLQRSGGADIADVWVVLFDGIPMIEAGVPEAFAYAQETGVLPSVSAVYVESIEGAEKRGPTRCSSLTMAATLDRFAGELDGFLTSSGCGPRSRTVLVGHSLGAIAAIHIASSPHWSWRDVALLSAALWWPGDDGQLSGDAAMDELASAPEVRIWMTAGAGEDTRILQSNDVLFARLSEAGLAPARDSHAGGHEIRPEDVIRGVQCLVGPLST